MQLTSDYKSFVLSKLVSMKDGQINIVKDPLDIAAIKCIMDWGSDQRLGFNIQFNSDMTKIRKDIFR